MLNSMVEPLTPCTWLLIAATCVFSVLAFRDPRLEERFIFNPQSILAYNEYYRLITPAFLHAGAWHLLLNMMSLYAFGTTLELFMGKAHFLSIYFGSVIGGNLLSLYVHRHHDYRAYGASGGVCGVIFAYILFFPGASIMSFYLPIAIPGWLYAIGFLLGSFYAMKAGRDNVGHDAHLGGAIIGLLITAALYPDNAKENWKLFGIVLGISVSLLIYVWVNPMFLPISAFSGGFPRARRERATVPRYKKEQLEVDAILEKVAASGMESLTREEKALLQEVSGKFRRRAESKKPQSDLPF